MEIGFLAHVKSKQLRSSVVSINPKLPTVIIAAFNESAVIQDTIMALLSDKPQFQIVVICNGCTDDTAKVVQENFKSVICHSVKQASKSLAIRYAESLKPGFPRLYLDADIILRGVDVTALFEISKSVQTPFLLIPGSKVVDEECSYWVKKFYRAWYQSPHVIDSGYGAGAYLINESGRARFSVWPQLTADDAFVRTQFNLAETKVTNNYLAQVKAPRTLWSLIKVKTRSKFGNLQLGKFFRESKHSRHDVERRDQIHDPSHPRIALSDKLVYLFVNTVSFAFAKLQIKTGNEKWHRDESNR